MTRFARAKGSKASNERIPEEATSWSEMRAQMVAKQQEVETEKNRHAAESRRQKNYQNFLQELEEEKTKKSTWADFPDDSPKKSKQKETRKAKKETSDDEAPAEESSKIPKAEVRVKKVKVKKPKLKIVFESEGGVKRKAEGEEEAAAPPKKKKMKTSKDATANRAESKEKQQKKNSTEKSKTVKPKKPPEELTGIEQRKIEKKKLKRLKQVEKKKRLKEAAAKSTETPAMQPEEQHQPTKKFSLALPPEKQPFKNQAGKPRKVRDDKEHKRRKGKPDTFFVNGREVAIDYVDGFPIKKEDAERIRQLRKQMISKGLPRSEIDTALKLERRKAEKAFAREKKKVCFNCRQSGHNLSECPDLGKGQLVESATTGVCFKCGSTEHTHFECKVVRGQEFRFAKCFICNEQGHIARQCPDNARGLYPKGGACRVCGDVTHLKKDCPQYQAQQEQVAGEIHLETFSGGNPDSLGESLEDAGVAKAPVVQKRPNRIVKF